MLVFQDWYFLFCVSGWWAISYKAACVSCTLSSWHDVKMASSVTAVTVPVRR